MATFLSKLFKPKWQSKHFETRKQAVESLNSANQEDAKILLQLAEQDPSLDIQQLAIQKITDTSALIALHKKAPELLKITLEKRLTELASVQSLSIFDLIIDLDLLTDMIIKATQADSFIRGLARIEDAQVLLKIASQSRNSQIRQAAAELLETEQELAALHTHAKNKDKTVYQITKNKLAELRSLAQKEADIQAQICKLIKDLNNLSQTEALQHFDARLSHVCKQWDEVCELANEQQCAEFNQLNQQCSNKLSSLEKEAQQAKVQQSSIASTSAEKENPSQTAEQTAANSEVLATLSTLEDTLNRFRESPAKATEKSALDALIKTQETRWLEATKEADVDRSQLKHYQTMMAQLRQYLQSLGNYAEQQVALKGQLDVLSSTTSLTPANLEQLRRTLNHTLKSIDWPNALAQPELLQEADKALEHCQEMRQDLVAEQKRIEAAIQKHIKEMDQALEEKQIKPAVACLKTIQDQLAQLESKQADRFQAGISLRVNQLNELRDWQGFANTPKQEELCEHMERLAEIHLDPQEKANKIKALQQEWKTLGGTGNQTLWNRFKEAADKAFEPCALFFAEQNQLKQTNLIKRQTLLQQVKDYVAQIDWDKASSKQMNPTWTKDDWKTADKINRQARQEWKDAFPVDFKANKPLQNEFYAVLAPFDAALENEKQHNTQLKNQLVDQAKQLAEQEDLDTSIQTIKSLQEKWKLIGITHPKADRKLWTEFRAACDALFARRDAQRDAKRSELDQLIAEANHRVEQAESACSDLDTKSTEELKILVREQEQLLSSLPELPVKVKDKLTHRVETLIQSLHTAQEAKEKHQHLAAWNEVARKATLLKAAYLSIQTGADLTDQERQANLAAFKSTAELPADLETEFESIWNTIHQGKLDTLQTISVQTARELSIACEIAAGIESPEADKALRMQLQVSRLSEGLGSGENQSRRTQLEKAMRQWYFSFPETHDHLAELEKRIEKAKLALLA